MKILYHYLRESDIIAAISNRVLGSGPLLSVLNYLQETKIDIVKCILFNDDTYLKDAYSSTLNKAIFRSQEELYFKLKNEDNNFIKKLKLFITKFFVENIKCKVEF